MGVSILVVDDEREIADLVEVYLKNENYDVYKFYSSLKAVEFLKENEVDLALLDIMMPELDGFALLQQIRERYHFPVIMLTAKEEEVEKITGLTLGADDYITKPFRPLELVARVKAQLRRFTRYNPMQQEKEKDQDIIAFSGLVLNQSTHECTLNEKPLNLTPTEFSILWILAKNCGHVVSPDDLFHEIWGDKYYSNSNNTIMVHIRHLREKMNESADNPKYIKTVWGVGYKIEK